MRFTQVFVFLLILAFLSAFVLPQRASDRARAQVQNLFAPVAWPARKVAAAVHTRMFGRNVRDDGSPDRPRTAPQLVEENTRLRILAENLLAQIDQLKQKVDERAKLGDVSRFCISYPVAGGDSALRDALVLGGSSFSGLANDMPVLYTGGLAGRISRAGVGGAQVLLVTDPQFTFFGCFVRPAVQPDGSFKTDAIIPEPRLVRGRGRGQMIVELVQLARIKETGLLVGDHLVIADTRGFPLALQGRRVGHETHIDPIKAAGFASVFVEPDGDLMKLGEVMVMAKD